GEGARIRRHGWQQRGGRPAAQHRRKLGGMADVLADAVEIEIRAAEVARRVLVGAAELAIQPMDGDLVEAGRPGDEILAGGEYRQARTVARRAEVAHQEFRVEAVAALFEVTAVRHLRNDVRRAEHLSGEPRQAAADTD